MKTQHAIDLAETAAALSRILGITPSAITQWGDDVPRLRVYELREKKPEWFTVDGQPIPAPAKQAEG